MLSKYEQETLLAFNAQDKEMEIYTADPSWMRKLRKLMDDYPANYQLKEEITFENEVIAIRVACKDKGLVTLKGERRKMSEEQRAICAERLRTLREAKSEPNSPTYT